MACLWVYTLVIAACVALLTEAVFPAYIARQTLIVVIAHAFKPLLLAPGLKALLVVLTATGSFGPYEVVRRLSLVRPLFARV